MAGQQLGVGDPAIVGRPRRIEALGIVIIGIHFHWGRFVQIHVPEIEPLIGVSDILAIRRPGQTVEVGRRSSEIDFAHFTQAVLGAQVQRVFAGLIGKISDRFSVRRPGRAAVGDAGRIRDVANIALFRGNRENFAVSFEDGANTGGRNRGVINVFRDFFEMGADFDEVGIDMDPNRLLAMSREIEQVERAELFVDNRAGAGLGGFNGQPVIFDHLRFLLGFCVVSEERVRAIAIGKEINRVADPKRIEIVPIVMREFHNAGIGEVSDPDSRRGAAPVVAPIAERRSGGAIGEEFSVGRVGAFPADGKRNLRREATGGRDGE